MPLRILKTFSKTSVVSRQMLVGVQCKVSLWTGVKDLDRQINLYHSKFLDICSIDSDELEKSADPLRPTLIDAKFEESRNILDKVDEAFKNIKEKYPDKQEVVDFLGFVDKPFQNCPILGSGGSH